MADIDDARRETLARMAQTRVDIRRLLDPAPVADGVDGRTERGFDASFPRSRTMRLLLSRRGISVVGSLLGGLIMARPALALRLVRMIPAGAVARSLLVKTITALRSRRA